MKTTKMCVTMAAMGLLAVSLKGAQAQVARRAGMRPARMGQTAQAGKLGGLLQQLNLTPAQKKQISDIAKAEKLQVQSIKLSTTLSAADKITREKATRKEARERILAVLTPDQKAQLKQLIAQRRQQKGQNPVTPPTGPTPGAVTPATPGSPAAGAKTGTVTPPAGTGTASSDDELGDLDDLA